MDSHTIDIIRALTPWLFAFGSGVWLLIAFVINKVFAKKADVDALADSHKQLKRDVDRLPSREDISDLKLSMQEVRGEVKEINAKLGGLEHMSRLLLENELKDKE